MYQLALKITSGHILLYGAEYEFIVFSLPERNDRNFFH